MTMRKMIGYLLIASPFAGLFVFITYESAFLTAVGIFSAVALIVGIICLGCYLVYGNGQKKEVVA